MTRAKRTNKHIGSVIKRKYGKVGFPKSAKRKRHLASIRPKKSRSRKSKR